MILLIENVFPTLLVRFFCKKKSGNFECGRITKFQKEKVFLEENAFFLLKGIFNKIVGPKIRRW